MRPFRKLTIWTIIANFFIVVGAGHGIFTLGLMEVFLFGSLFNHDVTKPLTEILPLIMSTVLTFIGQVILIISISKKILIFKHQSAIGAVVLFLGYLFLLAGFWSEPTIGITLFTAIPFVILVILLFFKSFGADNLKDIQSV